MPCSFLLINCIILRIHNITLVIQHDSANYLHYSVHSRHYSVGWWHYSVNYLHNSGNEWYYSVNLSALRAETATVFFLREPSYFYVFVKPVCQGSLQTIVSKTNGCASDFLDFVMSKSMKMHAKAIQIDKKRVWGRPGCVGNAMWMLLRAREQDFKHQKIRKLDRGIKHARRA